MKIFLLFLLITLAGISIYSQPKIGEPNVLQPRFLYGQNVSDYFGGSVASAGDVNGDGYDDLVVGAFYNDAGGNNAGRAYIYFGGPSMDYVPDLTVTGHVTNEYVGWSVSSAGDVNGDGYSDVLIGAGLYTSTDTCKVYLLFGGLQMDNIPDITFTSTVANEQFGTSVKGVGDLNGDGYVDVVIGCLGGNKAYIYFGGSNMDNTPDLIINQYIGNFGISVAGAGDVNADGFADLIVGAYGAEKAYLFYGGNPMNITADLIFYGVTSGDYFGYCVNTAGDVNGDGFSDIIIGAHYNDVAGLNAGKALLYFGGTNPDTTADQVFYGQLTGAYFGKSVASAGDMNGDGFSDIIVGSDYYNASTGRAYVYYGGTSVNNIPDIFINPGGVDHFGNSVASAGDLNGDGCNELIVGASQRNMATVFYNKLTGPDVPDLTLTGSGVNYAFGESVVNAGDVNGDGYPDILVGACMNTYGWAYLYYGGPNPSLTPSVTILGQASADSFGYSVAAGDVNGDGFSDMIIGAPGNDSVGTNAGKAYIFFGSANLLDNYSASQANLILHSEKAGSYFGCKVASAGDVNGDGFIDVLVGARTYSSVASNNEGRAYLYYGGYSMNNSKDITFTGANNSNFGICAGTAGDLNSDGYADFFITASTHNTNKGRVLVYLGGNPMNSGYDFQFFGDTLDNAGYSAAGVGDVNNDGYNDFMVGTRNNKAYLFYGSAVLDTGRDMTFYGEGSSDFFGSTVASAGDVNADGYKDFVIGAPGYNSDAGKGYLFFGGTGLDNIADITMNGETLSGFSESLSSTDYNLDGFSDIIFGSGGYSTHTGRAYVYMSSGYFIKPVISQIKDVPLDQGGFVTLRFSRSAFDRKEYSNLSSYIIERSLPPRNGNFYWEEIASVTPNNNLLYMYTAETWNDSGSTSPGTVYYRVTAKSTNSGEYWRSNILSGYSTDNLAPYAPAGMLASSSGSNVVLRWRANTETDLKNYLVYKYSSSVLSDTVQPIAALTDTSFTDTDPVKQVMYYFVKAQDIHSNKSSAAMSSLDVQLAANIKVFLAGPYNTGTGLMNTTLRNLGYIPLTQPYSAAPWSYPGTETVVSIPSNVVDWILVELRTETNTVAGKKAGFLLNNGTITDLDGVSRLNFPNLNAGSYYVVIKHRNHLGIMTKEKIALDNNTAEYNFTNDIIKSYGTNGMKLITTGVYGMWSGDVNGDGIVKYNGGSNDRALIYARIGGGSITATVQGYENADINMDGIVKYNGGSNDRGFIYSNIGSGAITLTILTQVPPAAK